MIWFRFPRFLAFFYPGIWRLNSNTVYLTFDDGPDPKITPWVLSILAKHNVKATFFCVGKNIIDHPTIVNDIVAQGHAIGNHTFSHEKGRATKNSFYLDSILKTSTLIKSSFFRPPYGSIKRSQLKMLKKNGFKVVFWSWLSNDFNSRINPSKILKKAEKIRPGDILVFHDSQKAEANLKSCLENIIELISNKGLQFELIHE